MKRHKLVFFLFTVITVCLIAILFFQAQYYNRQLQLQKENIYQIVGTAENKEEAVSIASEIIKGDVDTTAIQQGKKILSEYGYGDKYKMTVDKTFVGLYAVNVVSDLAICILFIASIFLIVYYLNKDNNNENEHFCEILEQFKNRNYSLKTYIPEDNVKSRIKENLAVIANRFELEEKRFEVEKEEIKSLVTDLSHQLKTPVASLKMCINLLEGQALSVEESSEFIKRSEEQVDRLESLVMALVNISRLETGMIKIQRENKSIFNTVISAVNSVYLKAENKQIEIVFDEDIDEQVKELKIKHDVKWTTEAIANVIENAVKYSSEGEKIIIRMSKLVDFVRIEVEDFGIGISKDEINKIFMRFYRGKSERVKNEEGSGIGLYLTRKILEEQYGSIIALPKEGRGTVFIMQLFLS